MNTTPSTAQELSAARAYYRGERISPNSLRIMDAETATLAASGLADRVLEPGAVAPDFLLPDTAGNPVRLYALLERGPVVLVFYRGGWCPYCNIHLRGFERLQAEFGSLDTTIVGISGQLTEHSLATQQSDGLSFPVVSDVGLHAARAFGLVFRLGPALLELYDQFDHPLAQLQGDAADEELPVPATFVIRPDRIIAEVRVNIDYTERAEPVEILHIVRELSPAAK